MGTVFLWVDPVSQSSFSSIFFHTAIYIKFVDGIEYVFSFNEHGLSCCSAVSCFFLTLSEKVYHKQRFEGEWASPEGIDWIGENC